MAYLGRRGATAALTTGDIPDNSITAAKIVADTITAGDLAPNSVDSSELVNGSVDLSHMSADSVDSNQYVDGSIDLVHLSVNSVDSDQYVDASIDTAHIGDLQVTAAKVAADVATQAELEARVSAATTAAQGVGTGDSPVFSGQVKKTYVSQLSRGSSTAGSVLELNEWGTAGGATLPGVTDGYSLGSVASVVIASGESIKCTMWSYLGDWNNDDNLNVVVWANDGSTDFFMKGTNMPTNWAAPTSLMFYNSVLAAGTYTFTVRFGSENPAYYGIWWGGRGVYGSQTWGSGLSEGFIQVDVIGA